MRRHIRNRWILAAFLSCIVSTGTVTSYGVFATTTDIRANICNDFAAPTVTEPSGPVTTDASSITIQGTGEPNLSVTITDNTVDVGTSTIAPDGSYGLSVPLSVGDNELTASSTNGCETKASATVTVHRTAPPQPPATPPEDESLPPSSETQSPSDTATSVPSISPHVPSIGQPQPTTKTPPPSSPGYMQPTITRPRNNETSSVQSVVVAGQASPYSTVTIYVNGKVVANVMASESGAYSVTVVLHPGKNTIQVQATKGKNTAFSSVITVYYTQPAKHVSAFVVLAVATIATASSVPLVVGGRYIYHKFYRLWRKG